MDSSPLHLAIFALCVAVPSTSLVCLAGVYYLRRVRIERPPIGVFNGRDVLLLLLFLSIIPLFYLALPRWLLTSFLVITFVSSLSIGFRPVLGPAKLWTGIGILLGLNIWMGNNALGSVLGWQLFWAENDIIVFLGAVAVANLYVQGGMQLRYVAWFALAVAGYDVCFTAVFPVTNALVEAFLGYPLDPSIGMRWNFDNAAIGIGDLFVYALFVLTAFKAYGKVAARIAFAVVVVFGAMVPALVPLVINYIDARNDTLVPAQAWFGPVAFLTYWLLRRRYGTERTMRQFLASDDVVRPEPAPDAARPEPARPAVEELPPSAPASAVPDPQRAPVSTGP
jgi:hypothetical protein